MIQRRGFLAGLAAALAAPAIIRTPGLLMPVKRVLVPKEALIVYSWIWEPSVGTITTTGGWTVYNTYTGRREMLA